MDKIPPSFLDRFGLPGFRWESVWKNDGNHNAFQMVKIDEEISKKETLLKQLKEVGDNESVANLENQIQELKNQQKEKVNSTNKNPIKHKAVIYAVAGIIALSLIGIIFMIVKTKKNSKTKL